MKTSDDKIPYSPEIERTIIGECMINNDALAYSVENIKEEMFYNPRYAVVFNVLVYFFTHNIKFDMLVITEELKRRKLLDNIGGEATIYAIMQEVYSAASNKMHCEVLKEKFQLRKIMTMCNGILDRVKEEKEKPIEIINSTMTILDSIAGDDVKRGFKTMQELLHEVVISIIERNESNKITGIPTGFSKLNEYTNGFQRGDTIVIGGQKKQGKSILGMSFAIEAASKGFPVGIFSLEMTNKSIVERIISNKSKIDTGAVHYIKLEPNQIKILYESCNLLYNYSPIVIDDSANLEIKELCIKAKRMKKMYNIELLIVDYVQLMPSIGRESRQREVEIISHELKAIAKTLNIPVVIISQLSRPQKGKEAAMPHITDLRDSGSLEADSSIVLLIHNPTKDRKKKLVEHCKLMWDDDDERYENIRELILAANRAGKTGSIPIYFSGKFATIAELV